MIYELYMLSFIFAFIFILKFINLKSLVMNKKFYFLILFIIVIFLIITPIFINNYQWLLENNNFINKEESYENMMFNPQWSHGDNNLNLQWFSNSNFNKLFAIVLFIMPLLFFYKNKFFLSNLLSFLVIYLPFLYIINRYFAPRYIYYSSIFYIIIYSCSIFFLITLHKLFTKKLKLIYFFLISIILISFFNPITVVNGLINENKSANNPKCGSYHRYIFELIDYLKKNNFSTNDILISSNSDEFMYYYNYDFAKNKSEWPYCEYKYNKYNNKFLYDYGKIYQTTNITFIRKIVNKFEKGWIIMQCNEKTLQNKLLPIVDQELFSKGLIYMGHVGIGCGGYDVYRW